MRKDKVLGVCGVFNDEGGRSSKIGASLVEGYAHHIVNGGYFSDLEKLLETINEYDVVLWYADVPNDKEKIITQVKIKNPHCFLVTSKRNLDGKYTIQDLIQRCLKNHSHLLVEFTQVTPIGYISLGSIYDGSRIKANKSTNKTKPLYSARVIDALGNQFNDWTVDMKTVAETVWKRYKEIQSYTRIGSIQVGPAVNIPLEPDFLEVIHQNSLRFHQCVYGEVPIDRFLGNAAFRCPKGFPSFKGDDDLIYVTRRNVDKSMLSKEGFVAVNDYGKLVSNKIDSITDAPGMGLDIYEPDKMEYYGNHKPSVDTPIQVKLYAYYKNAKYMIHSHVWVDDPNVPLSSKVIPCGGMEEYDEIIRLIPDREAVNFTVNLLGHGFIAIADNVNFIQQLKYVGRGFPEIHKI